jgi:hypothetical protein
MQLELGKIVSGGSQIEDESHLLRSGTALASSSLHITMTA